MNYLKSNPGFVGASLRPLASKINIHSDIHSEHSIKCKPLAEFFTTTTSFPQYSPLIHDNFESASPVPPLGTCIQEIAYHSFKPTSAKTRQLQKIQAQARLPIKASISFKPGNCPVHDCINFPAFHFVLASRPESPAFFSLLWRVVAARCQSATFLQPKPLSSAS
jgi:hypothetical protein